MLHFWPDCLSGGITPDIPCYNYVPAERNRIELAIITLLDLALIISYAIKRRYSPSPGYAFGFGCKPVESKKWLALLLVLLLSFAREVWLKFQQRDLITVIMHCYTMAIFQIVSLLAMKWNGTIWVDWLTRAYLPHMVFALGAMVMPDFHARSHVLDIFNFYLNHVLVLCIPIYILSHYSCKIQIFNVDHLLISLSTFLTLSLVSVTAAMSTKTNINFSMCPGAVDNLGPLFGGPLWRFRCIGACITIWFPSVNFVVKYSLRKIDDKLQIKSR